MLDEAVFVSQAGMGLDYHAGAPDILILGGSNYV